MAIAPENIIGIAARMVIAPENIIGIAARMVIIPETKLGSSEGNEVAGSVLFSL